MSEYLLTYLWVGMECVAAVLLFDAFSQRKKRQIAHWISVAWFSFLDATFLNLMSPTLNILTFWHDSHWEYTKYYHQL